MDLRNVERDPANPGNEEHPVNPAAPANSESPENPGRSGIQVVTAPMTANGEEARMEEESQQVSAASSRKNAVRHFFPK